MMKPVTIYITRDDLKKQLKAEWNDPDRFPDDVKLEGAMFEDIISQSKGEKI